MTVLKFCPKTSEVGQLCFFHFLKVAPSLCKRSVARSVPTDSDLHHHPREDEVYQALVQVRKMPVLRSQFLERDLFVLNVILITLISQNVSTFCQVFSCFRIQLSSLNLLSRELYAKEESKELAVTTFQENRAFYHPIAAAQLAKDLGLE